MATCGSTPRTATSCGSGTPAASFGHRPPNVIILDPRFGVPVAEKARAAYNPVTDACLARVEDGVFYGGVIFTDYTGEGGSISVHFAGFLPYWVNRSLFHETCNYVFNYCKCNRMFGQVRETEPKVLAFDLKLGFKEVAFLEGVFPDGGCHIVMATRADAERRWLLPKKDGVHG